MSFISTTDPQWFRAVYLNMVASKNGSAEGKIFYLDYGNFADVPMTLLRKMMPEFVTGLPVMGLYLEIKGITFLFGTHW